MRTFADVIMLLGLFVWVAPFAHAAERECGKYRITGTLRVEGGKRQFFINKNFVNRIQIELDEIVDARYKSKKSVAAYGDAEIEISAKCFMHCRGRFLKMVELKNPAEEVDYVKDFNKPLAKSKCSKSPLDERIMN